MAYNTFAGSKYEATKNLDHAELKKLIMAEVNAALPKGVRATLNNSHSYNSFRITVRGLPIINNVAFVKAEALGKTDEFYEAARREPWMADGPSMTHRRYSVEALKVLGKVEEIATQYNFDHSDIQSDYFSVNFYLDVEADGLEAEREKEAIMAAHSPLRAAKRKMLLGAMQVANDNLLAMGGLPQFKGRRPNLKPMKPLLKLTEKDLGYYFVGTIGKICGAEAATLLEAGLKRLDAEIEAAGGDWTPTEAESNAKVEAAVAAVAEAEAELAAKEEEIEMGRKLRAGLAAEERKGPKQAQAKTVPLPPRKEIHATVYVDAAGAVLSVVSDDGLASTSTQKEWAKRTALTLVKGGG